MQSSGSQDVSGMVSAFRAQTEGLACGLLGFAVELEPNVCGGRWQEELTLASFKSKVYLSAFQAALLMNKNLSHQHN